MGGNVTNWGNVADFRFFDFKIEYFEKLHSNLVILCRFGKNGAKHVYIAWSRYPESALLLVTAA